MRKRKTLVVAAALLAAVAIAAVFISRGQALSVETATVTEKEIARTVLASGYFDAREETEIVARYPLVITEVLVNAGDEVQKEQVLARADSSELEVERKSLEAEVSSLQAQITTMEATLPLRRTQAESAVAAAQGLLEQAKREANAMAELYETGAVTELEYRRAQSQLAAGRAELQQAEAGLAEITAQQSLLKQHREQVQALSARLELLEERLAHYQVSAPLAGRVAEVYIKDGAVVAAGTPLFLLHSLELVIKAEVLAQDAPDLALGQRVIVSGPVLDGRKLSGTLAKIHPRAVEKVSELGVTQRRVPIEVTLAETPTGIRPGYPVDIEIVTAETKANAAVTKEAVFELEGKDHVFQVQDGHAVLVPVEIGLEGEDYVEIRSGLAGGDVVINNPPQEIKPGTRVK